MCPPGSHGTRGDRLDFTTGTTFTDHMRKCRSSSCATKTPNTLRNVSIRLSTLKQAQTANRSSKHPDTVLARGDPTPVPARA